MSIAADRSLWPPEEAGDQYVLVAPSDLRPSNQMHQFLSESATEFRELIEAWREGEEGTTPVDHQIRVEALIGHVKYQCMLSLFPGYAPFDGEPRKHLYSTVASILGERIVRRPVVTRTNSRRSSSFLRLQNQFIWLPNLEQSLLTPETNVTSSSGRRQQMQDLVDRNSRIALQKLVELRLNEIGQTVRQAANSAQEWEQLQSDFNFGWSAFVQTFSCILGVADEGALSEQELQERERGDTLLEMTAPDTSRAEGSTTNISGQIGDTDHVFDPDKPPGSRGLFDRFRANRERSSNQQ